MRTCRGGAHRLNGFCCFNLKVLFGPEEMKSFSIKIDLEEVILRFSMRINT